MSQQINLANPLLLKRRYVFGLREMAIGVGCVLAGALAWAGVLHYQASGLEDEAIRQEALQADAQRALDTLTAAAQRGVNPQLTAQIQTTQRNVAQREALLNSVSSMMESTSTGFAQPMRALALSDSEGVWLNAFTLKPGYLELKGSTLDAALLTQYIDRLSRQAPFSGTQFSGMQAAPASQAGGGKSAVELPPYLDFTLYAGSQTPLPGQTHESAQ